MTHLQHLFPLFLVVNAAPVLNNTLVGWTYEPATRGTAAILFSCVVALGLCIWTAVHLNVEPIESSETRITFVTRVAGKLTWAVTALIAPELVLSIALHQFLVAWEYRGIVNKRENGGKGEESWWEYICRLKCNLRVWFLGLFSHKSGPGDGGAPLKCQDQGPQRNIKLKTAFFAVMGGFALRTTPTTALTITLDMLVKRGTMEVIRQYPTTAIDDKSKSDLLAKAVACFQAGWMLAQSLSRAIGGLPITLLELNTVVHVLNAIVMYLLWLKKPVDVGEPSSIDQVYGDTKKEESFVGVGVLEESLETVVKHHLPKFSGAAAQEDIDAIKVAHELKHVVEHCTTAYKERLDPPLVSFSTVLEAGVALGKECEEGWNKILSSSLLEGMEVISPFTDSGTALRGHEDRVRKVCIVALQKAFHSGNDGIRDGVDRYNAYGDPQKTDVDRATLEEAIHECISSVVARAFRKAFKSVEGDVRHAVRQAALEAAIGVTQRHSRPVDEDRQAVMREAFFEALPRNLERELSQELRPKLYRILRQHFGSDAAALAVLEVACLVAAPSPDTYGEEEPAPSGRLGLFDAATGVLSSASDETGREDIYKAVFEDLRERSYNIAESCRNRPEASADASEAAFKAAFHFNPMIVQVPYRERNNKTGFWRSMFNSEPITNQFITFPELWGDSSKDRKEFGKSWQVAHAKRLWLFSVLASAVYGGVHAFKWYAQFPTGTERFLWRISSCVGAAGVLPITAFGPDFFKLPVPGPRSAWRCLGFVTGLLFVAARSYIIIESFISLRRLPQSVYQADSWANSIPHV